MPLLSATVAHPSSNANYKLLVSSSICMMLPLPQYAGRFQFQLAGRPLNLLAKRYFNAFFNCIPDLKVNGMY